MPEIQKLHFSDFLGLVLTIYNLHFDEIFVSQFIKFIISTSASMLKVWHL